MSAPAALTDLDIRFFRDQGYLVLRGLLGREELASLCEATAHLVAAAAGRVDDPDFYYDTHRRTGTLQPFRVEYVVDKLPACAALLGHPVLLEAIEQLQGSNFIPTWDSLVFKAAGGGIGHAWHRDAVPYYGAGPDPLAAAIDVGIYLDGSDLTNCLWVLPGSNHLPEAAADAEMDRRNADNSFVTEGAAPVPVAPGDAILHNILTLHGSLPSQAALRRVVYYEFRQIAVEAKFGPHTPDYILLKQRVLQECLRRRRRTAYACAEAPFEYRPAPPYALPPGSEEPLAGLRFPHAAYWRNSADQ